jgi:uncharacterized membrane protein YhaH (DUF805 family)
VICNLKSILSFKGRIDRKTFTKHYLGVIILTLLFILALLGFSFSLGFVLVKLDTVSFETSENILDFVELISLILNMLMMIILLWVGFSATAKRLHDLGFSGWWQLLTFIPFVGIVPWFVRLLVCFFKQGKNEENKYGETLG